MNRTDDLRNIRAVAFDAVGTVIFADPPIHMAYHRIGRRHGSAITPQEAATRFREALRLEAPLSLGRTLATDEDHELEFWRRTVATVLPDVPDPQRCFADLYEHFALPSSWGCYLDVADCFETLRGRGMRLALASNFDARLHRVCEGHAELSGVTTRIVSSEIGWKKPSPEFFAALAAACELPPEQILMVGDDLTSDVEPALAAGMRALHLDRSGGGPPTALSNLEQLSERLGRPS